MRPYEMQLNPVWHRELRARWRGWRAFALLFGYVVVLAGVLLWSYNGFLRNYPLDDSNFDPRQRMSLLGHELFSVLTWLQAALWMLIAPVLTATSITSEREHGLMEGLQLSRLKAGEIVRGKLFSALSFCALLIVVTLPIEAVCFLMGGVSPGEFFSALILHASTALACAALGLSASSWSRKSLAAMALALVYSAAWLFGSFGFMVVAIGFPSRFFLVQTLLELFGKTNPILAAFFLVQPEWTGPMTALPLSFVPPWIISVAFSALSTLFWMWLASRGAGRILADPLRLEWARIRRELKSQNSQLHNSQNPKQKQNAPASARAREASDTKPARRWELGFLSRLRFSNPILGREVRACFRPRSSSPIMVGIAVLLAPFALGAFGWGIYEAVFDPYARVAIGAALLMVYLIVVIVMCALMSAGSFAREREASTLLPLRLSLLSTREILIGKMGVPLILTLICGVIFLPILAPCVRQMVYTPNSNALSLSQFLGALVLIASTAWCMTLVGLTFSWFSKRVVTATCCTIGTLFTFLIGAPALLFSTNQSGYEEHELLEFFHWWHPVFGMVEIVDRKLGTSYYGSAVYRANILGDALASSFVLFFIGAVLLCVLWRGVLRARTDAS